MVNTAKKVTQTTGTAPKVANDERLDILSVIDGGKNVFNDLLKLDIPKQLIAQSLYTSKHQVKFKIAREKPFANDYDISLQVLGRKSLLVKAMRTDGSTTTLHVKGFSTVSLLDHSVLQVKADQALEMFVYWTNTTHTAQKTKKAISTEVLINLNAFAAEKFTFL